MKALCRECKMRVKYSASAAWMSGQTRNVLFLCLERHEVYNRDLGQWVECPGSGQEVVRAR